MCGCGGELEGEEIVIPLSKGLHSLTQLRQWDCCGSFLFP